VRPAVRCAAVRPAAGGGPGRELVEHLFGRCAVPAVALLLEHLFGYFTSAQAPL